MNSRRSASVGALPLEKKHYVSRNESASGMVPDVRCACQYFQSDSLLPERVNPVDSRPSSKLGFHAEHDTLNMPQFHPMNVDAGVRAEQLSTHSFNPQQHFAHDVDRLSMRSLGAQRSFDQNVPPIDLAFVEKYPELEETARARGLVVQRISDASRPDTFMAGNRKRQLSVGSEMRDPDTVSQRSVTSLRRISRSPSKADLFVADIIIQEKREKRSVSGSRRTSNVDLSHFASHQTMVSGSRRTSNVDLSHFAPHQAMVNAPVQLALQVTPQLNLIAPTPSPMAAAGPPDYSHSQQAQHAAPPPDYRAPKLERGRSPAPQHFSPPPEYSRTVTPPRAITPPLRHPHTRSEVPRQNRDLTPPRAPTPPGTARPLYGRATTPPSTARPLYSRATTPPGTARPLHGRATTPPSTARPLYSRAITPQRAATPPLQQLPITGTVKPLYSRAITPQPVQESRISRMDYTRKRGLTPQRSPSPSTSDYRIAKPPVSTDYMRPTEHGDHLRPAGGVMPQNQPIDVSRYGSDSHERTQPQVSEGIDLKTWNLPPNDRLRATSPLRTIERARASSPLKMARPNAQSDPLQRQVAALEDFTATHNIEDVRDNIKVETARPPSPGSMHTPSLHLGEETKIEIVSAVPVVDIDALVQHEAEKAAETKRMRSLRRQQSPSPSRQPRQQSPPPTHGMDTLQLQRRQQSSSPSRQQSPPATQRMDTLQLQRRQQSPSPSHQQSPPATQRMDTLQLQRRHQSPSPSHQQSPPATQRMDTLQLQRRQQSPSPSRQTPHSQLQTSAAAQPMDTLQVPDKQMKRQRTPERSPSPEPKKFAGSPIGPRLQPQLIEMHTVTINGPLQEASPEAKSTYASRFKSMFGSKQSDATPKAPKSPSPQRQKSLTPQPSPIRDRSASIVPPKLLGMFTKSKPTAMEIVSGSNAMVKKKPEAEPMSVKVTETFSLKVDEMDQYSSRPAKPPPSATRPASPSRTIVAPHGSEDFYASNHSFVETNEPFAPIVIPPSGTARFLAGNRTLYSSEIDIHSQRSESEMRAPIQPHPVRVTSQFQVPKGALISVPINIDSNENVFHASPAIVGTSQSSLPQAPQGRLQPMPMKSSFLEGRTQSQDRAGFGGSHEDLYGSRITKTVSFHFDERKSRLSEFEKPPLTQHQQDQQDFSETTYRSRDHEYEPIGAPPGEEQSAAVGEPVKMESKLAMEFKELRDEMLEAEALQKDLEERYFNSETTTPRTESRTDYEIHTSQVDSSALEELPLKPENRKKGFMASAQDRTRKMQAGFKNQAGKIKTKLRAPPKKAPSGSPKAKERKRFKAPEFSKIKMPDIKRPDMSKLRDFKRPEFTKFNKPDMSKFKLPEKFSTLKLRRSKSFKENDSLQDDEMSGVTPESATGATTDAAPQKRMFEFNFGTYPRAFRKKKKPIESESSFDTGTGADGPSIIPSTETQPSVESSSSPQGDRGPGPVRSRWADKFSDVSYNDSEGSRYRRYGSEQESFDRESSLERRMKDDLEENVSVGTDMGILGGVADTKQFAEFDEENRVIHEISNLRADEFKKRPRMVHQDSDLRSEDSKDVEGWTDKEIQKNKLLRKAELEAEASYLKYPSEEGIAQETHSVASSSKKVVMEEIDDDEFFLRKRGISEDNIELRQYITQAIREGYDMPINALQHVGQTSEPMEYGEYDVPPPKPRRLHKSYRPQDTSQDLELPRSDYGDDLSMSQNGSDFFGQPKRPMRKGRSRSKFSVDSHDVPMVDERGLSHEQYFDDDEDYLRPPPRSGYKDEDVAMNDLNLTDKEIEEGVMGEVALVPKPPRRRKHQPHEASVEKNSYINGFSGRSVSNSYLQPPEDVIVYRTEHEYHIPLATPESYIDGASASSRKSRSPRPMRYDEDDRTSRGADSLGLDAQLRQGYEAEEQDLGEVHESFIIDMMENDGYAVVRKEHMPKPTPPARRKKFTRSPGERFSTLPSTRTRHSTPPPERPPPPRGYTPSMDVPMPAPRRKSTQSLEAFQNYDDDYEEPGVIDQERPESPRDLHSGEVINKMKYRPLPPPPRPPREKRQRGESRGSPQDGRSDGLNEDNFDDRDSGGEKIATSSVTDSYEQDAYDARLAEIEAATQTDPLPDDFECEEFEITTDMKVIEPRRTPRTLDELLKEEQLAEVERSRQLTEDEQLARGLQRFRDANQRSMSERSRTSSQADRSRSLSRPQTPSAVVIERRVSTPVPSQQHETMLEAALIVRPIDDLDLEEDALRREGLLTDSSQQSKSDVEEPEPETDADTEDENITKRLLAEYEKELNSSGWGTGSEKQASEHEEQTSGVEEQGVEEEEAVNEEESNVQEAQRTMRDYAYDEDDAERYSDHYDEDEEELVASVKAAETMAEETHAKPSEPETELQRRLKKYYDEQEVKDFSGNDEQELKEFSGNEEEVFVEEPPQPPPRRKSTTASEPINLLTVAEQPAMSAEVGPIQALEESQQASQALLPNRIGDLEVERLRVHALQAGQIMVSQLHGAQISADELECKSGSLVVKNIELPPGFIEDIVERVRSTERVPAITAETQTSLQSSNEMLLDEPRLELVPPPKPPRLRDLEAAQQTPRAPPQALDEQTQTTPGEPTAPAPTAMLPPIIYPTPEYLQSMEHLYNLRRSPVSERGDQYAAPRRRRHHSSHSHHRRRHSSSSIDENASGGEDAETQATTRTRTRSDTHPPEPQGVVQAGRQFISACSLSLVNIINQLTDCVRGGTAKDQDMETRLRQVPTLVVLFVIITFGLMLWLLTGKNVHTHHWDYFNPPGNEGRPS